MENTNVVAFDAYGTMFDVHAALREVPHNLGDQAMVLSALWRQKQLEYTWLRTLMGAYTDFWQVTQEALDYAWEAQELPHDPPLKKALLDAYWRLTAYPDVKPCLEHLRAQGKKTAILTNATRAMTEAAAEHAGISDLLDAILSVEDVQCFKPRPEVYQMVCKRFECTPGAVGFISSNAWDVSGAGHYGFQVMWLNRTPQPAERLPGRMKGKISSLAELS